MSGRVEEILAMGPGRWRSAMALDLTDEEIDEAGKFLRPGLLTLREMARRDDPYVWIDPWECR